MFKHGNMFQGILVGPEKDIVGVYFSPCPTYLDAYVKPGYVRADSKTLGGK